MFFCPIHLTSQYQDVEIDCIVDTIMVRMCVACMAEREECQPLANWFFFSQQKIPAPLKERLKQSHLHYYSEQDLLETQTAADYTCFRYLNQQPVEVHIYQCWGCPLDEYRVNFLTQKVCRYHDLVHPGGVPLHLAQDDSWLIRTFLDKS